MNIRFKGCAARRDPGRLSSAMPTQLFSFQKLQLSASHQMAVIEFVTATSLLDVYFYFAKGWPLLMEGEMPMNISSVDSSSIGVRSWASKQ